MLKILLFCWDKVDCDFVRDFCDIVCVFVNVFDGFVKIFYFI